VVDASITFVGNATTLLRLGAFTLLTDPNFLHHGQRAYLGYGISTRRRTEPAFRIDELPTPDAVLLSHLHGDHWDRIASRELSHAIPILTTTHAQRRLGRKFPTVGLRTWDSYDLRDGDQLLRVTAVPGRHRPGTLQALLPPVMGSIIDLEEGGKRRLRLYITGDTLYQPVLRLIPERFPDIDAMLVHLGGTRILGVTVTMVCEQGTELLDLVRPGIAVPIHYDDYEAFKSPLSDFLDATERRGLQALVRPVLRGETIDLPVSVGAHAQ
jgi:L-ascorbate metabolism protein UlaG (beta-lactamase superfamily)